MLPCKLPGASTARQRRLEQESFRARVRSLGGVALLVRSLEDLEAGLREEGVGL